MDQTSTNTPPAVDTGDVWVVVRLEKPEIYFLRYTVESYEGLCVPTTLPGGEGLVLLTTTSDLAETLAEALEGLKKEMEIEVLEWGTGDP